MNNLNVTIPVNAYERTVVEDPTPQSIPFDYDVNGLIDFDFSEGQRDQQYFLIKILYLKKYEIDISNIFTIISFTQFYSMSLIHNFL